MLFSGNKNANGSSWFGLWAATKNDEINKENYVPKETISDIIVEILATHNKITNGLRVVNDNATNSN